MGLKIKRCSPGGLLSTLSISPFPSSMVLENQARQESECGCGRRGERKEKKREDGRVRQRRKIGEERERRREEKLQKRLERDGERNRKEGNEERKEGERERERKA